MLGDIILHKKSYNILLLLTAQPRLLCELSSLRFFWIKRLENYLSNAGYNITIDVKYTLWNSTSSGIHRIDRLISSDEIDLLKKTILEEHNKANLKPPIIEFFDQKILDDFIESVSSKYSIDLSRYLKYTQLRRTISQVFIKELSTVDTSKYDFVLQTRTDVVTAFDDVHLKMFLDILEYYELKVKESRSVEYIGNNIILLEDVIVSSGISRIYSGDQISLSTGMSYYNTLKYARDHIEKRLVSLPKTQEESKIYIDPHYFTWAVMVDRDVIGINSIRDEVALVPDVRLKYIKRLIREPQVPYINNKILKYNESDFDTSEFAVDILDTIDLTKLMLEL